jgi:hypothetical protein
VSVLWREIFCEKFLKINHNSCGKVERIEKMLIDSLMGFSILIHLSILQIYIYIS